MKKIRFIILILRLITNTSWISVNSVCCACLKKAPVRKQITWLKTGVFLTHLHPPALMRHECTGTARVQESLHHVCLHTHSTSHQLSVNRNQFIYHLPSKFLPICIQIFVKTLFLKSANSPIFSLHNRKTFPWSHERREHVKSVHWASVVTCSQQHSHTRNTQLHPDHIISLTQNAVSMETQSTRFQKHCHIRSRNSE